MKKRKGGFTLIELMMVVAIIGVLATIAFPRFANIVAKAKDAAIKGKLGALRSAMNIYYSDAEGTYPTSASVLVPIYIHEIPTIDVAGHGEMQSVLDLVDNSGGQSVPVIDFGGWEFLAGAPWKNQVGRVWIACTHGDSQGNPYSSY